MIRSKVAVQLSALALLVGLLAGANAQWSIFLPELGLGMGSVLIYIAFRWRSETGELESILEEERRLDQSAAAQARLRQLLTLASGALLTTVAAIQCGRSLERSFSLGSLVLGAASVGLIAPWAWVITSLELRKEIPQRATKKRRQEAPGEANGPPQEPPSAAAEPKQKELKRQLFELGNNVRTLQEQLRELQAQFARAEKARKDAEGRESKADQECRQLRDEASRRQRELDRAANDLQWLQVSLKEVQEVNTTREGQLCACEDELRRVIEQCEKADKALRQARAWLKDPDAHLLALLTDELQTLLAHPLRSVLLARYLQGAAAMDAAKNLPQQLLGDVPLVLDVLNHGGLSIIFALGEETKQEVLGKLQLPMVWVLANTLANLAEDGEDRQLGDLLLTFYTEGQTTGALPNALLLLMSQASDNGGTCFAQVRDAVQGVQSLSPEERARLEALFQSARDLAEACTQQ